MTGSIDTSNKTVITSMGSKLDGATVQNLLDYSEFTTALVSKLQDNFVKIDGTNANDAVVTTMLGKLQDSNKVVTISKLTEETGKLANKDASNIDVSKFSDKLTTEASSTIKTELAKKADSTALTNLANKDGSNIDVNAFSAHLASKFATAEQLATKANASDLANKVDKNDATTFVKLDGTNATDAGVATMLGKLEDPNKVVTISKLTEETGKLANKDGSNIDIGPISTKLESNFAKLDGTNAKQGAELLREMLNMKANDSDKETILDTRLAKVDPKAVDITQYARLDGENINVDGFASKLSDNFVRLDGTNATDTVVTNMLSQLADKVVTTKELTAETATLAKLDGKNINVDDFANKLSDKLAIKDGSNITDGFSDALKSKFILVDGGNIEKSGLEVKLDSKFAAISSTSGGRTAAEADPTDTLPDSWANLI